MARLTTFSKFTMTMLIVAFIGLLGKCALDNPEVVEILGKHTSPVRTIGAVEEYDKISMRLPVEGGECVNLETKGYSIEVIDGTLIICKR